MRTSNLASLTVLHYRRRERAVSIQLSWSEAVWTQEPQCLMSQHGLNWS